MTELRLNHKSITVRNLSDSARFYQDKLGLPEIECGARMPNIRWFGIGPGQSIHLIEGDFGQTFTTKSTHLCISSSTFDATLERLKSQDVSFGNLGGQAGKVHVRADGVRSVYLQDPDGHWIEINEDF